MNAVRCGLLGLSLVLIFGLGDAAGQGKKKKNKGEIPSLVPQPIVEQLKLTDDQTKRLAALQEEYATRVKQLRTSMQEEAKKKTGQEKKDARKKLQASLTLAEDEARRVLEPRFEEILTPDQKKKYAELKKTIPTVTHKKAGPQPVETVKGTIQRVDPDKGTLVLNVEGKGPTTYRYSRATKLLNAAGEPLPEGDAPKAFTPGAAVSLSFVKADTRKQQPIVMEIRLAGK